MKINIHAASNPCRSINRRLNPFGFFRELLSNHCGFKGQGIGVDSRFYYLDESTKNNHKLLVRGCVIIKIAISNTFGNANKGKDTAL